MPDFIVVYSDPIDGEPRVEGPYDTLKEARDERFRIGNEIVMGEQEVAIAEIIE